MEKPVIYQPGDLVKIINEPIFLKHNNQDELEPVDLKHLIGLICKVISFTPNHFGDQEKNKLEGFGFYDLQIPLTQKGVPIGLLVIGFKPSDLEKHE